ncbi:unnamed protein product [Durusdinium trenchii]|uniref:Uncharacterized protein n=1 Tax=Durusdinium trenchii TaxID=1381693 RepID=A0ABP0K3H7_9DINO
MDLAEERLRQYCDDRLAEPRAEVPVPLQEVNIDAAQEQAAMVNTIPKIPQAAAGSGPTYVGVQDPAALRSPQRSNRSLSKASSPCLLNDCASNRSSPASSLYRRQSSDLATESLPALPPTETPRQLLPQQVEDTLDISFGLGTQGHEAEAARAAPSSPAEKPPAEPAEVVTVAQMEKPSAEPEVSEDPWEEILGSLAEVAPPRVSKADVWTKESSGDAECNFNSTLESSKEKEVEVEVEDEAEVSLQKPAESLEVKPDVHVDAPLAKPPEVEELHSELSEAEMPAQKPATESPEADIHFEKQSAESSKDPWDEILGNLANAPQSASKTEAKCIDSSGDEEESYSDSEYESYEEDEEEEEEQVTERVDAGIVLVDMDSGSSSVESGHRGTRPIDTE